jgi:hypothetical protein
MSEIFISGTSFNLSEVFINEDLTQMDYIAKVSNVNEFGFFELEIYGTDKKIKRHLTDCYDLMQIGLNGHILGVIQLDDGSYHLSFKGDLKDVYVITKVIDDELNFIARSRINGRYTDDITLAWFTFDKEQAERFATNLTIKELSVYTASNVKDVIKLESYMEDT